MDEQRHALVIATSRYRDASMRRLTAPGLDARELTKVLGDPRICRFQLATLRDKDHHVVMQAIDRFLSERQAEDTVLLYFSGHGIKDDGGALYLAARNTTTSLLRSTGIADGFLREAMKACRARRQVLILDCCFGGAFAKGLLAKAGSDTVEVNERFQGQGRVILTASTAMEFAFEDAEVAPRQRLSVFTKTLVAGLKSGDADIDGDGQISVQDLYDYVYKRITLAGTRQTPTISSIGQEGSIFIAQVPQATRTKGLPQPLASPVPGEAQKLGLRPWTRIRDQGPEGSNAAIAAVTALETCLARRGASLSLSARYVYQKAKQLAGIEQRLDSGVAMDLLARVLREFGAPPEKAWPYQAGHWGLPPKKTWKDLDALAAPCRARLIAVTTAADTPFHLARHRPVLAALEAYQSTWMSIDTGRRGVIAKPRKGEQPIGTVATTIVDYDAQAQLLHFAHTWGVEWGQGGFGEMSVEVASATFKDEEMWAVELREGGFGWSPALPA